LAIQADGDKFLTVTHTDTFIGCCSQWLD